MPELEEAQQDETPTRTSIKKLRRDMTDEELQRAREYDHICYSRKVAAKKAAGQSE